jgi:Fur family peroxide stress response transcriptional regulator
MKLLDRTRRMFLAWHRRDAMSDAGRQRSFTMHRKQVRHCVLDRRVTQGTRSERGQRYHENGYNERQAEKYLKWNLTQPMQAWREEQPGVQRHRIVCLSPTKRVVDSRPPRSFNAGYALPVGNHCHLFSMEAREIEQRLERFEALCRAEGLPLTVQRRDILKSVLERDDHPSADQIYGSVKDRLPGLSRTTVYRVLDTLVEAGVIRRLHHPGATARFDGKIDRHHHLICRRCQRVIDVESRTLDGLRLAASQRHGFEIEDYSVHFTGVCETCRRDASPSRH